MTELELLDISTTVGYLMIEHGAEIYRVEETIQRICKAYGVCEIDVFAIPSSLVVTLTARDRAPMSKTKRIVNRDIDFDKVERLNALSRRICSEVPENYEELWEEVCEIAKRPVYSFPMQVLATSILSCAFSFIFGGNMREAIAAFCIGALLRVLLQWLKQVGANGFFINTLGSGVVTFFALLTVQLGLADNFDKIIIGTLMSLVPGLAITNSMQDFIAGDTVAGLTKLGEALLTATGMAVGTAVVIAYIGPILEVLL